MNLQQSSTSKAAPDEFVAVEGGAETTSAGGLLLAAYILMWLFVFVFVWLSSRRLQSLKKRLNVVEQALKKADAQSS